MEKVKNSPYIIKLPIIITLALASGIFIGAKMFSNAPQGNDINKSTSKFKEILNSIYTDYVDTVNTEQLAEDAINAMLEKLDPHSVYIPPKEAEIAKSQLEGDFEGVGIEFQIIKDTLYVVTPISGGPSEAVGLQAGDKILKVDDKNIASINLTTQDVFKYLRGKKGTKVKVSILRRGHNKLLEYTITRDKIPTFSVDVAFMIDPQTGYIKVNRFTANTYNEFKKALTQLKSAGAQRLMLDLRGNPGGYMDRATAMADEFLDEDKLIVFTKGKKPQYSQKTRAYMPGDFEQGPVIVLIDEGSASASEIVSGALQDNDRGLIVGRRSFGKGLVQMPITYADNSELRLTISRYYTPSGRSIQKPYEKGHSEDYDNDLLIRYRKGEFFHADSIKFDEKLKYKTLKGRTVYGGGGIMPDIFIPRDTSMFTPYVNELFNKGVIREFALEYVFSNKKTLEKMAFNEFKNNFIITDKLEKDFISFASKAGVKYIESEHQKSKKYIHNQLKANIARGIWRNEGFFPIYLEQDEVFNAALKLWDKASNIEKGIF